MIWWALYYASLGWYVIPLWWPTLDGRCMCGDGECDNKGKHPIGGLVPNGEKDASISEPLIRAWWTRYPDANIGVCAGPSDLFIVDTESDLGYMRWMDLLTTLGIDVPPCYEQATGGGGIHQFWKRNGLDVRSANRFMEDVDRKGRTGYVVMAPSLHVSGRRYLPMHPDRYVTPDLPPQLATTLATMKGGQGTKGQRSGTGAVYNFRDAYQEGARKGYRDQFFNDLAFKMKREGHAPDAAVNVMRAAWDMCENPEDDFYPWEKAAEKIIRVYEDDGIKTDAEEGSTALPAWSAGLSYATNGSGPQTWPQGGLASNGAGSPSMIQPPEPEAIGRDVINAQRLADVMAGRWIWTPALGWCYWSGRWHRDELLQVNEYAKEVSRRLAVAASSPGLGDDRRNQMLKEAMEAGKSGAIQAMVSLARSDHRIAVPTSSLDSDPFVLATLNGTVILRTGEIRPSLPDDYITMGCSVEYDPSFTCEEWEAYLKSSFGGDEDLITYVRRVVGSMLVGQVRDKHVYVLCGPANSGKTTFSNILMTIMGDMAMSLDPEHLLSGRASRGNQIPPHEIARMRGKRLICSDEPQQGGRWAESLLKRLTGNDTMVGAFKYENSFEMRPTWSLLIAANHMPDVRDNVLAGRVVKIPTTQPRIVIPELWRWAQDPGSALCRAALAWAVRGSVEWLRDGIGTCAAVETASAEYRVEHDTVGMFMDECLERVSDRGTVPMKDVYMRYRMWVELRGEGMMSQRRLTAELSDAGVQSARIDAGRVLVGWRLRPDQGMWAGQGV